MHKFLVLFSLSILVAAVPAVATEEIRDLQTRVERYYIGYSLNQDGTHVETREIATKILDKRAVQFAKHAYLSYSTSVQKADVLEAYTMKADGRRLDVPKSNYQLEVNSGGEQGAPVFSDYTTLTLIFPDVAINDTTVLRYKIVTREPIFPKHFSVVESFPLTTAFDDVKIHIDAPVALWTSHEARKLIETVNTVRDGRRIVEWTFSNAKPIKSKRRNYSVYALDQEAGFSFSTFRSYAEIAAAYGERAAPKAVVSERIRKLADEIVKDVTGPREQARALYEWVALNIHYAGNCVGIGAVVPRDVDFVLDNNIGDCKDHATVLQALLAAKGIVNTQALVNAGNTYRLASVPVVSMVNHVINYIPSLDLYVDSTSNSTPFGMLPTSDADKPVLLVDGFRDGARTPRLSSDRNQSVVMNRVKIDADGGVSGDIEVTQKGVFAVSTRERMRFMNRDMEEESMKNLFNRTGAGGGGRIDKDDPKELLDTYHYKVTFNTKEFLPLPGAGAMPIQSLYYTGASIQGTLSAANYLEEEAQEVACFGGKLVEEFAIQFPRNVRILHVPKDVALSNDAVTYRSVYSAKGNTIRVKRTLDDRSRGNVCSIAAQRAYQALAKKALLDVRAQVLYK